LNATSLRPLVEQSPDISRADVARALHDGSELRRLVGDLANAKAQVAALRDQNVQLSRLTATERIALNVAHELSQPLAAVVNYLRAGQRLLGTPAANEDGRLAIALEAALAQALHASRIVSGVRTFVTDGEANKRVEDVAALVREAVALGAPDIEQYGVRLSLSFDGAAGTVLADRVQIAQVLLNLIRNAAQAMQDCPRRVLSITSRGAGEIVKISVADTGKGLPASIRDRLFEPFVTTRRDGTGLGLVICRAIIEAHGGTLSAEPAPGGGSIFHFGLTRVVDDPP